MTISPPVARLVGAQQPRILHVPEYVTSTGEEAVELAAMAGLTLDPWQQFVLANALGERADGSWAAFEVGVEVARQNGKGGILEARELAGLFLLGEQLIVHSAHEFPTAEAALERMAILIESCSDFDRRVKTIKRSHGQEGIYLKGGQALRYRTRTKGGGRGLSADCVVLDEAMHLPEAVLSALFPTLSARENPQLWYTGSAVDQQTMDNGVVFARLRARALKGEDPKLAYFGWSPDVDCPDDVDDEIATDPEVWAQSNPALGIRITEEYIAAEQRSMGPRGFSVERLGVGDWPMTEADPDGKIPTQEWLACRDPDSEPLDPVCLAFDVPPDRRSAVIAGAGWRADGLPHVGVLDMRPGTEWVAERMAELLEKHSTVAVLCAARSPAASLLSEFADLDIEVEALETQDHVAACGMIFDAVGQAKVRHLGTGELLIAVKGSAERPLGDAWAWARRTSSANISPLVAATFALWGLRTKPAPDGQPLVAFI